MNFLFEGWFHPKNRIGLDLMIREGMKVDFIHDSGKKYDWIINLSEFKTYQGHSGGVIYGPHLLFPTINSSQIPNLDGRTYCNLLSKWLVDLNEDINPGIKSLALPFAVDTDRFTPSEKTGKPVIYFKGVREEWLNSVIGILGSDFTMIDHRKGYGEDYFINSVSEAPFAIWIGRHESQGFAFQETLSCNTPIFVVDAKSLRDEVGSSWGNFLPGHKLQSTAASYFDDRCGMISEIHRWHTDFLEFMDNLPKYKPREFIVENLSPKACYKTWIDKLSNL
jgi:hypothetical protein